MPTASTRTMPRLPIARAHADVRDRCPRDRVHDAFVGDVSVYVLAYVSARRARAPVRTGRPLARAGQRIALFYGRVFACGALAWLLSLALPSPWRYVVWGVVLAVELTAPIYGWRLVPGTPIDPTHLPERFGLLTIIVLGESILAVVLGVSGTSWETASAFAAAGGFVLAAALWWTYFDFLDSSMVRRSKAAGLLFMYAHLPLTLGIASLGAGVKLAVLEAGGDQTMPDTGWLLGLGVAVCIGSMAVIQLATPPSLVDGRPPPARGGRGGARARPAVVRRLGDVRPLAPRRARRRTRRRRAGRPCAAHRGALTSDGPSSFGRHRER